MTAADPPPEAFTAEHARVLVVEDDTFDREYIREVLKSDFIVDEAMDGDQALALIDERDFDVVLADNHLPGLSGEHLLRECQDRRPVAARILLSGVLNLDTVLRSVNDGHIYACLQKPVDPSTLLTTVHNAARSARLIRERSSLIGELANANAQIYAEQQRLIELNAELRTLLTIATHDLREPLRSTRFFLDKVIGELSQSTHDGVLVDYISRVRRAHDRMDELLHGLREWLHLQTGDVRLAAVDTGVVVEEALDNLARLCTEREVALIVPDEWPRAVANAPLVRSVFENLITNAIKFSPDGPPQITIRWRQTGEMLRFEVVDKGIGVDPAYHQQIFGMFKRLESRRLFEGTGAGLAICQKIVQRHGGRMGISSQRGEGATMWFTLKAAP